MIQQLFFELIRVAIGTQETLSRPPSKAEWKLLYDMAKKQSLVGVCFAGVQKTLSTSPALTGSAQCLKGESLNTTESSWNLPEMLYLTWMGMAAKIQQRNEVVNRQCVELQAKLAADGIEAYVLKGQSLVPYYGELAGLRQTGDIDVWCLGKSIAQLVEYVKGLGLEYEAKHAHVSFDPFDGTEVELHPTPGELRCPWHNRRLQKWLSEHQEINTEFNLVFLMEHMYHHALFEGIGLRQFMDYYFVLKSRNNNHDDDTASTYDDDDLLRIIDELGMKRFAAGVMNIMHNVFGMPEEELLCEADPEIGALLLDEVMAGGNFGHYDERYKEQQSQNLFVHGFGNLKKKWPMLRVAFWEVVCSPFWSLWQISWRKRHGYY